MIGVRSASASSSVTSRQEMLELFQPWVLATYGDSAKTKTITLRKAHRIQALLRSEEKPEPISVSEPAGSEAAKFRLWVKSKGLALTRPGEPEPMEVEEEEGP